MASRGSRHRTLPTPSPPREALPDGLRTGDGVFETLRTYSGLPFLLDRHLERLRRSAHAIELASVPSVRTMRRACEQALDRFQSTHRFGDAVLRPMLFAGSGRSEFRVPVEPLPSSVARMRTRAVRVGISSYPHPGRFLTPPGAFAPVKWLARGPLAHALREARSRGWEEALLCDDDGRVIEGTRSNVLAIVDQVIVAPGAESFALPGITRGVVLEEARRLGLSVEPRAIRPEEARRATALLLTSSLMGVVPVGRADGVWSGIRAPRTPTAAALCRAYGARVRSEVRREVHPKRAR